MKTIKSYAVGITVSFALAGWLSYLGLIVATRPNLGWGTLGVLSAAIVVGGPLLLILLAVWVYYALRDREQMPASAHALLILPLLLSLLIVPIGGIIRQDAAMRLETAHPPIAETHVNLSGKDLWLKKMPDISASSGGSPWKPLSGARLDQFTTFRRYPRASDIETGVFPYEGVHLKDRGNRYAYRSPPGASGPSLPLRRRPYPDLGPLVSAGEIEASMLVHIYFHYPDHVEVAPALARFASATEEYFQRVKPEGLMFFDASNCTQPAVVRVEVNGQTLDMGDWAIYGTSSESSPCPDLPYPLSGGFLDVTQPFSVRWQTTDDPQTWHEATIRALPVATPRKLEGQTGMTRVLLCFLPSGSIAALQFPDVAPSWKGEPPDCLGGSR